MSLRSRLLAWFTSAAALTLIVVMTLVDGSFRRQIQTDLEATLIFARQVATGAWEAQLRDQVETSAAYAMDPRLRAAVSTDDPPTIDQTLREVFQGAEHLWAAVLTPGGRLVAATPAAPRTPLVDADPLLEEARFFDTGDLRAREGRLELVAASAVLFGADPLAILVTGHTIDEIDLGRLEDAAGRAVLLLGPASAVAGPGAAGSGVEPQRLDPLLDRSGASSDATAGASVRLFESSGERFLAAPVQLASPTQGGLGALVLLQSLDAALAPANDLRTRLLVILALGLLLTLALAAVFSRGITVPVGRLLAETERLARGDLERPVVPLRDDEIGRLATAFDHMRVSLGTARSELLRAERLGAIGQAASAVAHDFSQPLSTISGAVGLLRMGVACENDREECFDAIESQIHRLGRMREEIVEFARGERDFQGAWIRFDSFLENTVSGLKADLAPRGVSVRVEHGFTGSWWIDSDRLGRVVENLVRNSGDAGATAILVRTEIQDETLMVWVEDDGSGIPEDLVEDIFEPFVTRGKKEGTGLGLAIARNVVVEHGGTIGVASGPGRTVFTIQLPDRGPGVPHLAGEVEERDVPTAPAATRSIGSSTSVAVAVAALALTLAAAPGRAQVPLELSGQIDLVAGQADERGLNDVVRGDSPFNPVRLRLYARSWITDRIGVFSELLYDTDADLRVNGAYMVINEIADQPWLSARVGLAPSIVGSFGLRSTYFNANPLIGVPLVWHAFTDLSDTGTQTADDLLSKVPGSGKGMPLLYDPCWNIQWELLGELGAFEYSIGVTPGSLSNPVGAIDAEGHQVMGRLGTTLRPGVRLGVSGAYGPYLSPLPDDGPPPYPGSPPDYDQTLVGLDLELLLGRWAIFAEGYRSTWEAPLIEAPLDASGGFVEARYDVATGWYVAGRAGGLLFGDVTDTDGRTGAWDDDLMRYEAAVGYRLTREMLLTVNWQRTATRNPGFGQNLLSARLSAVF